MAYSAATYKGDGSQSTFMIPFDYLQKDFVKVTINEVDKVYAQDYNVDGRELSFPTAPPSGSIIKVYRETPTDRMVKWNEGSVLTSSNMTTQQIQELHLIEETTYNLENSAMVKTEDGHKWEGKYLPIAHVGNPIDDSDAVNLGMIKKEETGFLASVRSQLDKWLADLGTTYNSYSKSLKESFDSYVSSLKNQFDTHTSNLSTTFNDYKTTLLSKYNEYLASLTATKDAVKNSEANASKYKDEAKSSAASAKDSATQCADAVATCTTRVTEANQAKKSASASANTATTKATESGNSASLAKKWAVSAESPDGAVGSKSAKTWAEEAKSSEQKATTSANNAKASENNSKASEVNAKASETASANSATASAKSATAAKGSEDKAKTSEVNAKASEVAAAESANQAAAGQINADWNETNANSKAYIKNKPAVYPKAAKLESEAPVGTPTDVVYAKCGISDRFRIRVGGAVNAGWVELATGDDNAEPIYVRQYSSHGGGNGDDHFFKTIEREAVLLDRDGNTSFPYTVTAQNFTGLASKATADAAGNNIQNTYAKKSDLSTSVSTTSLTVTGATSVPTANAGNSSKAIANTEFVAKSIASLVNGAPDQLNTLNELAKALGNNSNFAATMTAELAKKLNSTEAESTYATKREAGVPYQIKRNTAYKVGDVLTSPSLPPGCVIVVTQAGTTGSTEPDWTTIKSNMGGVISDGTVTFYINDTLSKHSIGDIVYKPTTKTGEHEYLLPLDGQTIDGTKYKRLVDYMGTTTLPNLNGRYLRADSTPGQMIEAGLPNITGSTAWAVNGTIGTYNSQNQPYHQNTGALSVETDGKAYGAIGSAGEDSNNSNVSVNIDASRSSAVYGNSTTVTPPTYTVRAYICYA